MMSARAQVTSDRPSGDWALTACAVLAAVLALAIFGYLARLRPPQSHIWGDEGTYMAMAASLARDGDLAFTEADRDWALARGLESAAAGADTDAEGAESAPHGVTVILQRTGAGITYSKPLLYPLLAALPYKLFGEPGILLVNVTALALGLLLAGLYLRRLGSGGRLWLTLVTFAAAAALAPYLAWRMSESLQMGLALAGLVLACGGLRRSIGTTADRAEGDRFDLLDHPAAAWIGGALLGMLTAMRTSNALLLAGALTACVLVRGLKRSLPVGIGATAGLLAVLALSQVGLGTISPYTAERASFNARIGYPVGPDAEAALARFEDQPATHRPHLELSPAQRYSALYFFVGRHTGLLAYFPLALVLMALIVRRPSRLGLVMLATTLALAGFYLLYTPYNYFGGSTFIGNRYFLIAYAALLVGLRELPSGRALLGALAIGLTFGASAVGSVRATRDLDGTSQSHAAGGAFRLLPYESTAREIQGQKYRFWSGDYLRFTSPFATVQRRRFLLHSDRPYAELMLARSLVPPKLCFLVRPAALAGSLQWKTATGLRWRATAPEEAAYPGVVSIEAGRTWRQHPLGWASRSVYDLRMLRLRLDPARQEHDQAEVYYLGSNPDLLRSFPPEIITMEIPTQAIAGGKGLARIEIRNPGPVIWSTEDTVLPITIGYRLTDRESVVSTSQRPIDQAVAPGRSVRLEVEIDWPTEPGEYQLALDIALHPVDSVEAGVQRVVVAAAAGEKPE